MQIRYSLELVRIRLHDLWILLVRKKSSACTILRKRVEVGACKVNLRSILAFATGVES